MKRVWLTLCCLVLLGGLALAVPSGELTEEAREEYFQLYRENNEEDDWLWNISSAAQGETP